MTALFRDRIVFPISTPRGEVVAFGGRAMEDGPKYLNTPETAYYHKGEVLYGMAEARERIKHAGAVHVAEGYLDVIALDAAGSAAVAPLGHRPERSSRSAAGALYHGRAPGDGFGCGRSERHQARHRHAGGRGARDVRGSAPGRSGPCRLYPAECR